MLKEAQKRLSAAKEIAIDFEAWSPGPLKDFDVRTARILGIGLAVDEPEPWTTYLDFNPQTAKEEISPVDAFDLLRPIFQDTDKLIIAHNAKFERTLLRQNQINCDGRLVCTMLSSMLVDENRPMGLKWLVEEVFKRKRSSFKDTKKPGDLFGVDMGKYCEKDSSDSLELYRKFRPQLENLDLWGVLMKVIMPSVELASDMDIDGVRIDMEGFAKIEKEYQARIYEIEKEANEMVGHPVNMGSTKDVSEILFEELGLTPPEGLSKGKSGYYSTSAEVLKMIADQHPFAALLIDYRTVVKILGTYITPMLKRALEEDGRIRANWKPCMAETGRWRCARPNLQNIPRYSPEEYRKPFKGQELRGLFLPADGMKFISADYSQIELRLTAYYSHEANMIQIYQEDGDIHQLTADLCSCSRQQAKAVNFGCIYGMQAPTLRKYIWIYTGVWPTPAEAEAIHKAYFRSYPGVLQYHKTVMRCIRRYGYVSTITGRRRRKPKGGREHEVFRELVNSTIQGSATDLLGIAIRILREKLKEKAQEDPIWGKVKFLLQIHDEIDLEAPNEIAEECAELVRTSMEEKQLETVPIKADVHIGNSWAEAKG